MGVVAFLGAMQVIGTQAQGDDDFLREISEEVRVAQSSIIVSGLPIASPVTSGIQPSEVAPLPSRSSLASELAAGTDATTQPVERLAGDAPAPEAAPAAASPAPEASPESQAASNCAPGAGPYCIYVVQEGDTLSTIAENLGLEGTLAFSAAELIALSNGLNDAENWLITVGQELWIPAGNGVIHTVTADESVSLLAELYGVTSADIVAANNLGDANSVVVGSTLLVPEPSLWPLSGPMASVEADPPEEATPEDETPTETPESTPEAAAALAEPEDTPDAAASAEAEDEETESTAAPVPSSPPASSGANPSVTEIKDLFAAGYIAAGGPPQYLEHMLAKVISCESGYNLRAYNPAGPFFGLMQFLPQTWANTGGGDWFDPWQQGHNTGVLLQRSNPLTQWPFCWR